MKTKLATLLGLGFLLTLLCGNVVAQTTPAAAEATQTSTSTTGTTTAVNETQSVINHAINNPNVLVITGKIIDGQTKLPVGKARINFDKFGDELLQASIDEKGNYALALNKNELGDPIRIIFKVSGYKKYVVKSVDKNSTYVDIDVYLQPMESEEKSNGNVTYKMDDDPFNPLVIKLQ